LPMIADGVNASESNQSNLCCVVFHHVTELN